LGGQNVSRTRLLESLIRFRDDMAAQGREVVYYGDQGDSSNRYAIVMYWRLSDDKYGVVLGDLSIRKVSSDMLICLQSHMLQRQAKK
jgi:hypothetical protein